MTYIRNHGSGQFVGNLDASDSQFLANFLQLLSDEETTFYVDRALLDSLEANGAPLSLRSLLLQALGESDGVDVRLSHPLPPSDTPLDDRGLLTTSGATISPRELLEPEEEFIEDEKNEQETHELLDYSSDLTCLMCRSDEFVTKRMRTQVVNRDGSPESVESIADFRVCMECGFVHLFMTEQWFDQHADDAG